MATQMATPVKLTKDLYTDITRLRLLDKPDAEVRFRVTKTPFTNDDDDDDGGDVLKKPREEYVIRGLIYPMSEIYKERAFEIEIKLPVTFPLDPPKVHFVTPIYHPSVEENGEFCDVLLSKTAKWTPKTSLVEIVRIVVAHIDNYDSEHPARATMAIEYKNNRAEFDRKAREHVLKHGLPRN